MMILQNAPEVHHRLPSRRILEQPGKRGFMTVRCILGIALISIVVIWAVASYTAVRIVFARTFGRTGWENYPERPDYSYFQKTVSREPVSFPSGKNTLRGYIYGKEKTNGLIVFSHGILCGHEYALPFIAALVDRG